MIKEHIIDIVLDAPNLYLGDVLRDIQLSPNGEYEIAIQIGYPLGPQRQAALTEKIRAKLNSVFRFRLKVNVKIERHVACSHIAALPSIKNIIGIASGKGGVGKSTTAVNIALALAQEGANVGLLDADIYGPNQPHLLGGSNGEKPGFTDDKKLIPLVRHGIQTMSMGYLVDEATPMVWRGPMISSALNQLLNSTAWSDIDYLIVDLPPGTGDIQLTLTKQTPLSAVVVVTTPQDVALLDVRKAIAMFTKMNVPTLGVVENMSTYVCHHCGHEEPIFGTGGGETLAQAYNMRFLGRLPLSTSIRETSDSGMPIMIADPHGAIATTYHDIAINMAASLSTQKKSYAHIFGKIAVENTHGD